MSLRPRGFTVLELVLALGLFAVVMTGVSRVGLTQRRSVPSWGSGRT